MLAITTEATALGQIVGFKHMGINRLDITKSSQHILDKHIHKYHGSLPRGSLWHPGWAALSCPPSRQHLPSGYIAATLILQVLHLHISFLSLMAGMCPANLVNPWPLSLQLVYSHSSLPWWSSVPTVDTISSASENRQAPGGVTFCQSKVQFRIYSRSFRS